MKNLRSVSFNKPKIQDRSKISSAQIKHIWYLVRKMGLDDAWLYGFLQDNYRQQSLHALGYDGANTLINDLRRMAGEVRENWRITRAQIAEIEQRAADLKISEAGLRQLCLRVTPKSRKKEVIKWLSWAEARGLIACLQRMRESNIKKAAVPV